MHYRAFFTSDKYLTSADLYDEKSDAFREITVTIDRVVKVKLIGKNGKTDGRPGLYFKEQKSGKPLGLNAGNSAAVANVAGSTDMKRWPGVRITLFVEMAEHVRGEGIRPAIRVRPFRPDQQRAAKETTLTEQIRNEMDRRPDEPDDEEMRAIAERDREEATR